MNRNEKHEVIARIARRSLVLVGLLGASLMCAGVSHGQSSPPSTTPGVAVKAADAGTNQAQSPSGATTPKPATPPERKSASRAKGAHEGITVHGHWTIEVKNPDGTVASRHEFENKISPIGADLLTGLLSGQYVSGGFMVFLTSPGVCGGGGGDCSFFDTRNTLYCPASAVTGGGCGTLTYTPNPSSARPAVAVGYTLTGTVGPVSGAGQITAVDSGVLLCFSQPFGVLGASASGPFLLFPATPQTCGTNSDVGSQLSLTSANLSTPYQSVIAGQSIAVTVVITFGSS